MSNHYLLDTKAAIAQINGNPAVASLLTQADTVLGELYFDAENSDRVQHNLSQAERLAAAVTIRVGDQETARRYGRIEHHLRHKGRKIPQNDTWIAAIALQYGLTLLTRDAHFDEIDGLTVQAW